MENFPQTYEPTGSMSILEQFVGLKNFMNNKLNSNEYVKTIEQTLTEEQKAQARENIGAGASSINVIDNLTSQSNIDALSANQGRVLNEKIDSSVQTLNQTISQNTNELQQDIDANGGDIASLQGDVSELNQTMQRTLKTPLSTPYDSILVGIDDNGDQLNLNVGNGLYIANGMIGAEHPVNSYYLCKTGSNSPASIFGGTWVRVAENVVLPLGNTAPVTIKHNGNYFTLSNNSDLTGSLTLNTNEAGSGNRRLGYYTNSSPSQYAYTYYKDGLTGTANLSNSSNVINGVDVWFRET